MRLGNTEFVYFIDYIGRKIHLLDCNESGRTTVTNAIDPKFQNDLVYNQGLIQDVLDFEWICYGTDGIITSYKDYNFKFVNPKLPWVYAPYVDEMEKRRGER